MIPIVAGIKIGTAVLAALFEDCLMKFSLHERTILLTVAGSRAYGTSTPESDLDLKGVAVPTKEYFLGFSNHFEQAEGSHISQFYPALNHEEKLIALNSKMEGVVYDIRKFIKLAAEANPNILDVLFCREDEVRFISAAGKKLRDAAQDFISAKCHFSYSGYAFSQLKRIKNHRQYLLNPPKKMPERIDFGLPEKTLIPADQLASANASVKEKLDSWSIDFTGVEPDVVIHIQQKIQDYLTVMESYKTSDIDPAFYAASKELGISDNLIWVMQREREYENSKRSWTQYQNWKASRNKERAKLEEESGFDRKHAMHLIRLLHMGREILKEGKVNVWRGDIDANLLNEIRNGGWTYEQVVEYAEKLNAELSSIYESASYVIPKIPNKQKLDQLCQEIVSNMI